MPRRSEIDPVELTIKTLPNLAIIQKAPRPNGRTGHRLRLVGEALCEFFEVKAGQFLEDLATADVMRPIIDAQKRCMQGEIVVERVSLSWKRKDRPCLFYRKLLLPFSEHSAQIDTVLALIIFEQQPLIDEHIHLTERQRKLGPNTTDQILRERTANSVDRLSA